MNKIIEFTNQNGNTLRGILHYPKINTEHQKKEIFIMPNGGIMGCEGDFRAHVRIARILADAGYYVFRFSPAGTGNSDGYIADCRQKNLFCNIESGLFVTDMINAVKYIETIEKFDSIALTGICGGAITLFLSAASLKEIDYVIPIGVPVYLDSDQNDYVRRIPVKEAELILKNYTQRLLCLESWLRVITLKTDFKVIKNSFLRLFNEKLNKILKRKSEKEFNSNPKYFQAAKRILKENKKVLFIFGGNDGFWMEFKNNYLDKLFFNVKPPFDYYLVPGGNHMLTSVEMQIDAAEKILDWMKNTDL